MQQPALTKSVADSDRGSKPWGNQPNRQQALETTIPALCSVLFALISGVFVAAAMTDSQMLDARIQLNPLVVTSMYGVELAMQRRLAVLVATTLAGFCFYKCLLQCVWSQMSHFDESRPSPDVDRPTGEEVDDWEHIQAKWDMKRRIYATTALVYFEIGMYLLPLSMMPLLPPGLLALALYIWLLSLGSFFQALQRSQAVRSLFSAKESG